MLEGAPLAPGALWAGAVRLAAYNSSGADASAFLDALQACAPSPRTNRTRRVPHPVLIGHAAAATITTAAPAAPAFAALSRAAVPLRHGGGAIDDAPLHPPPLYCCPYPSPYRTVGGGLGNSTKPDGLSALRRAGRRRRRRPGGASSTLGRETSSKTFSSTPRGRLRARARSRAGWRWRGCPWSHSAPGRCSWTSLSTLLRRLLPRPSTRARSTPRCAARTPRATPRTCAPDPCRLRTKRLPLPLANKTPPRTPQPRPSPPRRAPRGALAAPPEAGAAERRRGARRRRCACAPRW